MCACVSICANECLHGDYVYIYIYKENTGWWYTLATVMYKPTWWCQVASDDLQKIRFFLHQPGSFPHQGQFTVIISSWYRWVGSFIGKHTLEITLLRVIPARHRTYILPYISLLVFCCFSNILSNFLHATWHLLWRSTWHCSWHSIWQILWCFTNNIRHSYLTYILAFRLTFLSEMLILFEFIIYLCIYSGILSCIYSDILSSIAADTPSGAWSDKLSGILPGIDSI